MKMTALKLRHVGGGKERISALNVREIKGEREDVL
jgi:hypothetical protein